MRKIILFAACLLCLTARQASAQESSNHNHNTVTRLENEILIFQRLQDVAYVDYVRLAGPPKAVQKKNGCEFQDTLSNNDFKFYAYVFIPKSVKQNRKYPLVMLTHGGVHGNFSQVMVHFVRELVAQGYIVAATDYRGSTGYGKGTYEAIDYGGLENEDVLATRDYMVECYSIVDSSRVGLLGWSHGGMISLMNILRYPDKYACAYAGVPVSDVAYRLSYQHPSYIGNFNQPYHIGGTPQEKPEEYARRSPVSYAKLLSKPLMITTCINDDDVSWTEVNRMIEALKAENKEFSYKIYPPMAGAHLFERMDMKECSDIRFETYRFLAKYLKPGHPFKNTDELRAAGYYFY